MWKSLGIRCWPMNESWHGLDHPFQMSWKKCGRGMDWLWRSCSVKIKSADQLLPCRHTNSSLEWPIWYEYKIKGYGIVIPLTKSTQSGMKIAWIQCILGVCTYSMHRSQCCQQTGLTATHMAGRGTAKRRNMYPNNRRYEFNFLQSWIPSLPTRSAYLPSNLGRVLSSHLGSCSPSHVGVDKGQQYFKPAHLYHCDILFLRFSAIAFSHKITLLISCGLP
jgi:hypothetical protein